MNIANWRTIRLEATNIVPVDMEYQLNVRDSSIFLNSYEVENLKLTNDKFA